ncbi:hypothetical protein AALA17_04200 [Lactobacillaceae bacterium 24-114]
MAMTEEEKREIAKMTIEMLRQDNGPKVTTEWQQLSREIKDYCENQSKDYDQPAYTTIQNAIYNPIRFVLGVHRIDTLRGEEVDTARKIFEFIKQQREEAN